MKLTKLSICFLFFTLVISCNTKESKKAVFQPDASIGKDTSIYEGSENDNYSTLDRMQVLSLSSNDSIKNDVRSLLRFGFSTLEDGVIIDSAFIHLQSIKPGHFGKNNSFLFVPVKEIWIGNEVNWKNQPSINLNEAITLAAPEEPNQNYKINVTEYITAVYKNKQPNYGFMIMLKNEKNSYKGVRFHSSNSKDTSKHPKLEIYYKK